MQHKIGAYIRVSTDDQANVVDGSIDSQQHRIKSFIELKNHQEKGWGKIIETYIEDGYSAKNTKRPAYQRMVRDMQLGKINLILVADLSRLSRNITDFCNFQEELKTYKAKFLSIKDQFDSTTPAGEMMLINIINLAQFERKQTSERVSLNFHSRALRGLSNGGRNLLGYDRDPTNPGKFIVNPDEARVVKKVFGLYLESKSLGETARKLNQLGYKPKVHSSSRERIAALGDWTIYSVRTILKNMSYLGLREINKLNKSENQNSLKNWQKYQIVKAAWPAIIDQKTFDDIQKTLDESFRLDKQRLNLGEERIFLLSGILRCEECGHSLIGQTAHGGSKSIHRYYGHSKKHPKSVICSIKNVRADEIENAILNHLNEILKSSNHIQSIEKNIENFLNVKNQDTKKELLQNKDQLKNIQLEIEQSLKFQTSTPLQPNALQLMAERLENLAVKKQELNQLIRGLEANLNIEFDVKMTKMNLEDRLSLFTKGWKKTKPIIRKRLLRRLIDCLLLGANGLKAYYFIDEPNNHLSPQKIQTQVAAKGNPLVATKAKINQLFHQLARLFTLCGG